VAPRDGAAPDGSAVVQGLVALAARGLAFRAFGDTHYRLRAGQGIDHLCAARLVPGMALLKLDAFRQQWQAEAVSGGDRSFVFLVSAGGNLWQRCLGRAPGLEVRVRLLPPRPTTGTLTTVVVTVRPLGCGAGQAAELLEELGPALVDGVRNALQARSMPGRQRYPFTQPVPVCPVLQGRPGEAIAAQGKDISLGGMGLYLPCRPPSSEVYLQLTPVEAGPAVQIPAHVVRSRTCDDGRHEVGVRFPWEEEGK
jgi:hypothetical protein